MTESYCSLKKEKKIIGHALVLLRASEDLPPFWEAPALGMYDAIQRNNLKMFQFFVASG